MPDFHESPGLLEINGVDAAYGARPVLRGIDLSVPDGGISAIIGANGAGKTTLLRAISGMVRTKGEIRFDGQRIDSQSTERIARRGIGHVPEGRGTIKVFTVEENLRLGAHRSTSRADVKQDMDRVFTYFPKLRQRLNQAAGTLSGGEQQMLAFSRALMARPRLLMLDEPSFGLAPIIVQSLFDIMVEICRNEGVTILLVEQNVELVFEIADHCCVLETGRVALTGPAAVLRENESIRRTYLGY